MVRVLMDSDVRVVTQVLLCQLIKILQVHSTT